jgi:hypothetical protein
MEASLCLSAIGVLGIADKTDTRGASGYSAHEIELTYGELGHVYTQYIFITYLTIAVF